jgi:hypothetical protein
VLRFALKAVLAGWAIRLAGPANWWLPGILDRLLRGIDVEGTATPAPAPPDPVADAVARFVGTRRQGVRR